MDNNNNSSNNNKGGGAAATAASRKRHDEGTGVGINPDGDIKGTANKKQRRPRRNRNNKNNRNNNNDGNNNNASGGGGGGGGGEVSNTTNNNNRNNRNNNNRNNNNRNNRNDRNNNNNQNDKKKSSEGEAKITKMEIDINDDDNKTNNKDTDMLQPVKEEGEVQTKCSHQFSNTKFVNIDDISFKTKKAINEVLKYEYMTKVQDATLKSILHDKKDVVAKAKTGSGKTTAFLLPIIENLATINTNNNNAGNNNNTNDKIVAVILSPTRELANQISVEFTKLATFHPKMKSQVITMIGGTNIGKDQKRLAITSNNNNINIRVVIATPGRLQDHLNQNTANLVQRLSHVQVLCLDEADRLLDMGFRRELERIISYMPQKHTTTNLGDTTGFRQTLLFSATFPDAIKDITKVAMRPDYEMIDTIGTQDYDGTNTQTNVQVVQKSFVVPLNYHIIALEDVLQQHIESQKSKNQPYKIMVFFTTARIAGYMADLFRNCQLYFKHYNNSNLLEMHSRKSQSYRTNVAKQFTSKSNLIMFSSDVSARGVDYPNVSCVVQVGAPSEKAQYIHRLGRTARAGNSGVGVIILNDFESVFLTKEANDLDIQPYDYGKIDTTKVKEQQEYYSKWLREDEEQKKSASAAYQAFLGYYNSNIRRLNIPGKDGLVQIANDYSTVLGFPKGNPPPLQAKTVGKMGLKGVPGLVIERGGGGGQGGGSGGGRGGGGRGGGGRGRGRGGGRGGRGGGRF